LESVKLFNSQRQARPEDESASAHPENLTKLLRAPSLRSVDFFAFSFTPALCQATANALTEGMAVTKLKFWYCSFLDGECTSIMANGLSRNTSVLHIEVISTPDYTLLHALAAALPSNSTIRDLFVMSTDSHSVDNLDLSPIFSALGKNTGLKNLNLHSFGSMDESLSTAMKDGLGMNVTLESLKSLTVHHKQGVTESCLSAFRTDIAAMLQDDSSLESLSILTWRATKAEDYIGLVTALQHNTMLKTVCLGRLQLNDDESKHMAALLKKNYALENLPDNGLKNEVGDVGAILRLNEAGRRYLIEDGSSISKGVDGLSRVNNNINCVFLHLLENPRLCDRSAVEKNSGSTSPTASNVGGKREPASVVHRGRESRRRLA
jgi:hypothetical protein